MAPGGRFIIGLVHGESSVPARKLKLLVEIVKNSQLVPIKSLVN
jgi:hypothetical protein